MWVRVSASSASALLKLLRVKAIFEKHFMIKATFGFIIKILTRACLFMWEMFWFCNVCFQTNWIWYWLMWFPYKSNNDVNYWLVVGKWQLLKRAIFNPSCTYGYSLTRFKMLWKLYLPLGDIASNKKLSSCTVDIRMHLGY
jgi:hypothetical protein